jgi:hypothetical protein
MYGAARGSGDGELVDLLAVLRSKGWSDARIVALRNTCAAAAAKDTYVPREREIAAAVASALSGRTAGVPRSSLGLLTEADLI